MITKKILVGIQLFFFIFVVSMASSAMASSAMPDEDSSLTCAQKKVYPLLVKASNNLAEAYSYLKTNGMEERTSGKVSLLKAHANITVAQLRMIKCGFCERPLRRLLKVAPEDFLDLLDLVTALNNSIPVALSIAKLGVEILTIETILLIVNIAIDHASIETAGLIDLDALNNISRAQAILAKIACPEPVSVP